MGKKKDIIHAPQSCGGVYHVLYHDNGAPHLRCDKCDHTLDDWFKWESEYKTLWENKLAWAERKNSITCLLGYFCARYKDHYGIEYTLSLNEKGLFRGPEMNILRRIYAMFNSNAEAVKDYIDFIYARKVHKQKKRLTSLSLLAVPGIVQEYKLAVKKSEKIDRNTPIPQKMVEWVTQMTPGVLESMSLTDFGDLKTLLTHYQTGQFKDQKDIVTFVQKLYKLGYIDESHQIKNWRE